MNSFPKPAPSRLEWQWHEAGFVAHHSCGTVAASHRLPRATIQIGKQQTALRITDFSTRAYRAQIDKSDLLGSPRMSVILGEPLAGFPSTRRSVSKTFRSSDSVITS